MADSDLIKLVFGAHSGTGRGNVPRAGRLEHADASVKRRSPPRAGFDRITVDVVPWTDEGRVAELCARM